MGRRMKFFPPLLVWCIPIGMLLFLVLFPPPVLAGPALDCEGSAKAYALQGIPCYCRNGQIVCDQPSGKGKSKKGHGTMGVNAMLAHTLLDALFTSMLTDPPLNEKDTLAAKRKAAALAAQRAEYQRAKAAAAQAEFEKMMLAYKQLEGAQAVSLKTLSNTDLALKSLDDDTRNPSADGSSSPQVRSEQMEFETQNAEWMKKQRQLIEERLREPNRYAGALYRSLRTNAPPPPWKKFDELQPGDVVLLEGEGLSRGIAAADNAVSSSGKPSTAAHTVIYLKEVNGKKLFLDNQPFRGPHIISEEEFLERYSRRGAQVARLAQPLKEKEGKDLFSAAVEMAQKNRREVANNWFGTPLLDTHYGPWGKDNVVCSEADWALINAAGRNIPKSGDRIKTGAGVDFSPADFQNSQYFLVTPLW